MERLKSLRNIVYIILAIFFVQLVILIVIINPSEVFVTVGFAVLAILCIYLARVALVAIGELIEKHK